MRITIDPLTRLSSNLRVTVELTDGSVTKSQCSSMSYRGFEQMLAGKDPMDAPYFTQRICGMCSSSHATAASGAIEIACEATRSVPKDALVIRNILNGLSWMRNHIEHLYLGFLPDLADPIYREALKSSDLGNLVWNQFNGRFAAVQGDAYADTVRCIKLISRAEAILGGRSPHMPAIVPGGVTARPTGTDIYNLKECMDGIDDYLQQRLLGSLPKTEWLSNTHDGGTQDYIFKYASKQPFANLSPESGWGDLQLFLTFCSRMFAKDVLSLPTFIELDTLGGYPLDDQLVGFLSYGSFYKVKDDNGRFQDGYAPIEDERTNSFELAAGFTPGGMENIYAAADRLDPNLIVEHVYSSFYTYSDDKTSVAPLNGETVPTAKAKDIGYDGVKYSFAKSPRYGRVPCEVGPLSRMINMREKLLMDVMRKFSERNSGSATGYPMASVYTRIVARMQELLVLSRMLRGWIENDLEVSSNGRRYCVPIAIKPGRTGDGLIEAPRGALGHWLKLDNAGLIANYQVVAPTTWNASPRCSELKVGPIELALLGGKTTPSGYLPGSEANPVGLYHVVRSFDPCVSCAVHTIRR